MASDYDNTIFVMFSEDDRGICEEIVSALSQQNFIKNLEFKFSINEDKQEIQVSPHKKLTTELVSQMRTFCLGFKSCHRLRRI